MSQEAVRTELWFGRGPSPVIAILSQQASAREKKFSLVGILSTTPGARIMTTSCSHHCRERKRNHGMWH